MQNAKNNPLLKFIVNLAITLIPFKWSILKYFAKIDPIHKTELKTRALGLIANKIKNKKSIETNMGIDADYKCFIPISEHLIVFGKPNEYRGERGPLELASSLTRHANGFVDIGAHLGYFVFYVQNFNQGKPIFYFEPNQDLFNIINNNVTSNKLNNISGTMAAVGNTNGPIEFYNNKSALMGSIKKDFSLLSHTDIISVESIRFSDFLKNTNLNNLCVKVDIEGAEFEFLEGAKAEINKIDFLIIEVLGEASKTGFVKKLIDEFDFNAYYINDYKLIRSKNGEYEYVSPEYNWLFCKHNPLELKDLLKNTKMSIC